MGVELSESQWIPTYKTRAKHQKIKKYSIKSKISDETVDRKGSSRKGSRPLMTIINHRMFSDTLWSWFDAPV